MTLSLENSTNKIHTDTMFLWPPDEVPLSNGTNPQKDLPTITAYWPDPLRFPFPCPAFVIASSGGYRRLHPSESKDLALFLNEFGIAGFDLKYRLGKNGYHYPVQHLDVMRAIRTVRYHGKVGNWNIDPNRVGIMGGSAGGHLAALALTRFDVEFSIPLHSLSEVDRISSRPDLGILYYPVITMQDKFTHKQSRSLLLGPNATSEMFDYLSNERYVSNMTSPTFLFHTEDDHIVSVENTYMFNAALEKAGVKHEMYIDHQLKKQHNIGLDIGNKRHYDPCKVSMAKLHPWTGALARFLVEMGWVAFVEQCGGGGDAKKRVECMMAESEKACKIKNKKNRAKIDESKIRVEV